MDVGSDNFRFKLDDPEAKANTYRFPKTSELHLDSLDRYTVETVPYVNNLIDGGTQNDAKQLGPLYSSTQLPSSKCRIETKRNLIYGYMSRVALTQFNLAYSVPTVTASSGSYIGNNIVGLVVNGNVPIACTIPPGFYTVVTLARALQVALIAGAATGVVPVPGLTVIPPTNQTTVLNSGSTITSGFTINSGNPAILLSLNRVNTTSATLQASIRTFRLLGINTSGTWGVTPSPSIQLGIPNLLPTDYVDIVSSALTNYKDTKDANSSVQSPSPIGRVWLTEGYGNAQASGNGYPDPNILGSAPANFCKTWQNPNWSQWSPNQAINAVDITLLDMFGQPLFWSVTYQTEWSATLTVTE